MMIIDEPEWQIRQKTMARLAYSIRDHTEDLNLISTEDEIRLFGENKRFYSHRCLYGNGSPKKLSKDDMSQEVNDVVYTIGTEGYSPSLANKILLKLGYLPKKIKFQKN